MAPADRILCHCGKCQTCRTRKYRSTHREKHRAWMNAWQSQPEQVAKRKAYIEANREKLNAQKRAYNRAHRDKQRVYDKVRYALKKGRLVREPCEVCGAEKVEAHHDDYSKPLDVRWLCTKHHKNHHREMRLEEEKAA